jgi:hypothetical protein
MVAPVCFGAMRDPDPGPVPSYDPFNPQAPDEALVAYLEELKHRDRNAPITLADFGVFSLAMHLGFTRVTYQAEYRTTDDAYFWITDLHAQRIGEVLTPALEHFGLQLTRCEHDGYRRIADHAHPTVQLEELLISHKTADEETPDSCRDLAHLVTMLKVKLLRLWTAEYEDGALDALADELRALGNTTLVKIDVCDLTKAEPDDVIHHEALDALVAANLTASGDEPPRSVIGDL